jgi:PTH1 family peptidyl-tRNA hydrolase
MWLIMGLGNPGADLARTRHNLGFLLIDSLSENWSLPLNQLACDVQWGRGSFNQTEVVLAKPLTFMNQSGPAVASFLDHQNLFPSQMVVVLDDLDLPLGKIRLREKGGSGGHKGLESVIEALGRIDFPRLRLGIGRPPTKGEEADYVLSKFSEEEWPTVRSCLEKAREAIEVLLKEGLSRAMELFNQ